MTDAFPVIISSDSLLGASHYLSARGLGNFSGVMKQILPQKLGSKFHLWIYRGGGSQIWFPFPFLASKWSGFGEGGGGVPKNENMKRYTYTEMPSVRFFCGSAQCHTQVQTFYKVYIVSNFSYTKGQFTTPPPHQKCHCSMSGNRKR